MKFGLVFENGVSKPFTSESERRVYLENIEYAVLAEELGFDQIWVTEHYFLEQHSHSPAPETWLAYLAAMTSTIRICHGVRVLLPQVTHPAKVAASAAFLDVLTGGRLEFGTGRQSTWAEMGGFGISPDDTKGAWDEVIRAIPQMWADEDFSWDGEHFSMPPRPIYPKPYQKPHPPLWVAVQSPSTAVTAGELGLGFLGVSFGTPDKYVPMIQSYREAISTRCNPVGAYVNEQVNSASVMFCAPTDEEAVEHGQAFADAFFMVANQTMGIGAIYPSEGYRRGSNAATSGTKKVNRSDMPIGSPSSCIKAIKRWEEIGVDRMLFFISFDDLVSSDRIKASLRLFAEEVMPAFAPELSIAGVPGR